MVRPRMTCLAAAIALGAIALTTASCERSINLGGKMRPAIHYSDLKRGAGPPVDEGRRIGVHYTASLPDGTVFLDTRQSDGPHHWIIGGGGVIQGVDDVVRGMRLGGRREATIPPELHWGRAGYAGIVPPDTSVTFVIELVSVQ